MVFHGKSAFQNTIVEGAISEALFGVRLLPPILNVTQESQLNFTNFGFHLQTAYYVFAYHALALN